MNENILRSNIIKIFFIISLFISGCTDMGMMSEDAEKAFNEASVSEDSEKLTESSISFAPGDTASSVTSGFSLPTSGAERSTITWSSSNTEIITVNEDGSTTVTRPSGSNATVILTATVSKGSVTSTKTITVTVLAGDVYHTITFSANGGSGVMSSQSIEEGAAANLTANAFTRDGYTFIGWDKDSDGAADYVNGASYTMGSSDVTLFAVWTALPTHTINFNANGGSGSMSSQTVAEGAAVNLTANAFTRDGYTFTGWDKDSDGAADYANGASYTMGSSDITLFAVWTVIPTHTITFNANGGSGSMGSQSIEEGATVNLNANSFTYAGQSFSGWAETPGGSVAYTDGGSYTMGGSDEVLYAVWTSITHTVTFNANEGSGSMSNQSIEEGATAILNANTFTRTGHVFAGWSTVSGGAMNYADGQEYTMGSGDVTLYAVWRESDDLIAKYTFDEQDCSDTSNLLIPFDKRNNGTSYNVSYTSDGNGGYAASFNGSSSYIKLPNSILVNNTTFTVMMRFKVEDGQKGSLLGYQNTTVGTGTSPSPDQFIPIIMVCSDGKLLGELWTSGGDLQVFSTKTVDDGNWHTVYFSASANSIALYLDGELLGTRAGTVKPLSMIYNQIGTSFGRARDPEYNSDTWYYFEGLVDNFYLYNTALH